MRYILTAIIAIGATICHARTIYVDANGTGDYPTIAAAVNDSNTGDVIILLPGTYTGPANRNIDFKGKSITVQSTDPCNPSIAAATVIDCQRLGRAFSFVSGESILLAGFTIINGITPPVPSNEFGDAIYSNNSRATIFNCVIKKCGGYSGISHSTSSAIVFDNSSIKLIGSTINENGLALDFFDSNAEITGCTINKNTYGIHFSSTSSPFPSPAAIKHPIKITDSAVSGNMSGIMCSYSNMTIDRTTISDNNIPAGFNGISGIYAQYSNVVINDSIISRNESLYSPSSFSLIPDAGGVASVSGTLEMNNCVVSDNRAVYGGGITNSQGSAVIQNCIIANNTAGGISANSQSYDGKGGGIYGYSPTQLIIEGCTIKGNKTEGKTINSNATRGGGICSEGSNSGKVSIKRSSIIGNSAYQGGGVNTFMVADMNNCFLANNEAQTGGGAYCSLNSICINCTFVGNKAISAAGLAGSGAVTNCIFWDDFFSGSEIGSGFIISYSNVRWASQPIGSGNISADPLFAFKNDGRLLPGSPCIDAGTNILPPASPPLELSTTDLDGNPRVIDGDSDGKATVDMGAFEFDSTISRLAISDSDFNFSCAQNGPNPEPQVLKIRNCSGGSIDWEIVENCPWLNVSAKNGTSSGIPSSVTISIDANQLNTGIYQADMLITSPGAAGSPQTVRVTLRVGRLLSVPQNFITIQKAIDEANNGDWVIVADGVYTGAGNRDIDFKGKAITVCSQNGPETCIIDCNGTLDELHRGFIFQTNETYSSILDGFTITNGYYSYGGAILMGSTPTIKNCVFLGNTASYQGGAISTYDFYYGTYPVPYVIPRPIVMAKCSFIENSAEEGSGAIHCRCSLKLTDCNFIENVVTGPSGMMSGGGIGLNNYSTTNPCSALIEGCNFSGNSAKMGGVLYTQSGNVGGNISIINSAFIGNLTGLSGGALIIQSKFNVTISNSLIAGNRGEGTGGLLIMGPSQISNCTIVGNVSLRGYQTSYLGVPAAVRNCIISNYGPGIIDSAPNASAIVTFSNIRGGFPGEGNFDIDPGFVRPGYWADTNGSNIIREPNDINAFWVNGDYHLRIDSPCIDAGDPNYVPGTGETDLDGNTRVVDVVDMGAYEHQNTAPIADAGPNQIAYAWIDGIAEINLDGSGSYDVDGDKLTYLWRWSIDGNDYEANGVSPTIELPAGQYTFELVVNDGIADSEPNQVVITVVGPIKSTLWVTPRIIDSGLFGQKTFMAIVQLPAGISKNQVDANKRLICYPGEIKASRQFVMSSFDSNRTEKAVIWAYFDSDSLAYAVSRTGWVDIDVVGQLKTGQYFYGSEKVWVAKPIRKPIWHCPGYGWSW